MIQEDATEESVHQLLGQLYEHYDFQPHATPIGIAINVYQSEAHYKGSEASWLGKLTKSKNDDVPHINIVEDRIVATHLKPEDRFGLSEKRRRAIYLDLVRSEDRAELEAEVRYPPRTVNSLERATEWDNFTKSLCKKYLGDVARQHGISASQLDAIRQEGLLKSWPMPKPPFE